MPNIRQLADAARAGELETARALLAGRPDLINLCIAEDDEHRALHHAVIGRHVEMVRLLMQHGADSRLGIWPHRDATRPRVMARERGYTDILAVMDEEEARRQHSIAEESRSPNGDGQPGDAAQSAIVANDADWLRAGHASGALAGMRGLVTHAITSERPAMLRLLLELGCDPDEAGTVDGLDEVVVTFGEPLRACASTGQLDMADCLLEHGANPNTQVYAASSALFNAHQRRDAPMIALLERHGARLDACAVGLMGLTDQAATLLTEAAAGDVSTGTTSRVSNVAKDLMWGAIESHAVDIVRMALDHVSWPRDDGRWYDILRNGFFPSSEGHRAPHVEGLRLTLDRADPNLRSKRGSTLLHYVAAAHGDRTADDRITYASLLLDAGARLDLRDDLLNSTPLGWACRWGRTELVRLFLERGADPVEPEAEPWATPVAWAEKMQRSDVLDVLREYVARRAATRAAPSE